MYSIFTNGFNPNELQTESEIYLNKTSEIHFNVDLSLLPPRTRRWEHQPRNEGDILFSEVLNKKNIPVCKTLNLLLSQHKRFGAFHQEGGLSEMYKSLKQSKNFTIKSQTNEYINTDFYS